MSDILSPQEWNLAWDAVIDAHLGEDEAMAAMKAEDKLKKGYAAMRERIAKLEADNAKLTKMVDDGAEQMQAAIVKLNQFHMVAQAGLNARMNYETDGKR